MAAADGSGSTAAGTARYPARAVEWRFRTRLRALDAGAHPTRGDAGVLALRVAPSERRR
jgi:hypothetical protein